jgi:hypothetical protein
MSSSIVSRSAEYRINNPEKNRAYLDTFNAKRRAARAISIAGDSAEDFHDKECATQSDTRSKGRTAAFYVARQKNGDDITPEIVKAELEDPMTRGKFSRVYRALRIGNLCSWEQLVRYRPINVDNETLEFLDGIRSYDTIDTTKDVNVGEADTEVVELITVVRKYEFTSDTAPDVSGSFVYHVSKANDGKVGKHSGSLKLLASRYKTSFKEFDVVAFDCDGFDYSTVEKMILLIMKTGGYHTVREQVLPESQPLFISMMTAFFEANPTRASNSVCDVMTWYNDEIKEYVVTHDPNDYVHVKTFHDEFMKHALPNGMKLLSLKDFDSILKSHTSNVVEMKVMGVKSVEIGEINRNDATTSQVEHAQIVDEPPALKFFHERFEITNDHRHECGILKMYNEYSRWRYDNGITREDGIDGKKKLETLIKGATNVKSASGKKAPGAYGKTHGVLSFIGVKPNPTLL